MWVFPCPPPPGVTPEQQFVKVMNDELVEVMGAEQAPLARRTDGNPTVILLAGLQGTGKTTAAAKLAKYARGSRWPGNDKYPAQLFRDTPPNPSKLKNIVLC